MNTAERVSVGIWIAVGVSGLIGVFDDSPRVIILALSLFAAWTNVLFSDLRKMDSLCEESIRLCKEYREKVIELQGKIDVTNGEK